MQNIQQTIINQYSQSSAINNIINLFNQNINPTNDFNNIYDWILNIDTASGFGLDIIGRIVGAPRIIKIPMSSSFFGFAPDSTGFGNSPFWDGYAWGNTEANYSLTDGVYRNLILVKMLTNITSTTVVGLNGLIDTLLSTMFNGRGAAYLADLGSMQMRYIFEFTLTDSEIAMLTQNGILPRPAGVQSSLFAHELPYFGFALDNVGFDQSPFVAQKYFVEF
jgi:Protein of unknown function (DUF2612)